MSWVVPWRSFLAPKSRVSAGLAKEALNVRLAALNLRVDLEGSRLDPGIPGILCSLNSRVSHFLLECHLSV